MKAIPCSRRFPRSASGSALVIVLAFLVMITFAVMAFFIRATTNQAVVRTNAGGKQAALLASSAADLIVGDLKNEMALSSNASVTGNFTWLMPTSPSSMMPTRTIQSSMSADSSFNNLVKQSGSPSAGKLIPAGAVPTTSPSKDGSLVTGLRWSAPSLTGNANGTVAFTDSQVPNWILFTRSGVPAVQSSWDPSFSNSASSNSNFVIGRFAFNVYDEGGLLDVNVAGFPQSVVSTAGLKGSQGLVDLGLIPGVADAETFVKTWRNLATGQSSADYLAYLGVGNGTVGAGGSNATASGVVFNSGPKSGFLKSGNSTTSSDNRILSRQDLIRLANSGSFGITTTALPFLTSFSRGLNAPTFTPDPNRPKVIDPQMASKDKDDEFNPGMLSADCMVTEVFTRPDGSESVIGTPLLKHRFPLSRLALLTPTATAPSPQTDPSPVTNPIGYYFGLSRASASDPWVYNHGKTDRILKMSEIQGEGREPDFFELLQAGISIGSLGKGWRSYDQNYYYQILQIGANLINQASTDSWPRRISFNNGAVEIIGVTNLPYISRVIAKFDRDEPVAPANPGNKYGPPEAGAGPNVGPVGLWFQAEVWNPHQNAATPPPGGGPTQFRYYAKGSFYINAQYLSIVNTTTTPYWKYQRNSEKSPLFTFPEPSSSSGIQFGLPADAFTTPTLLTPANITSAEEGDSTTQILKDGVVGTKFVGLYTTSLISHPNFVKEDYYQVATKMDPLLKDGYVGVTCWNAVGNPSYSFFLQYQDPSGNWITYNTINNVTKTPQGSAQTHYGGNPCNQLYKIDLRSNRFGYSSIVADGSPVTSIGTGNNQRPQYNSLGWPGTKQANWGANSIALDTTLEGRPITTYPGFVGTRAYYGFFVENDTTDRGLDLSGNAIGAQYYSDPDGVIRPGNGNRAYGSGVDGQELQLSPATSRPIILNRPFRSVAEMGYAFRDSPWKSLDFSSAQSADAALLDFFCINEPSQSPVFAGVLNLNTRQQPVLKAVVSGVIKNSIGNSTLSSADADQIVSSITDGKATVTTSRLNAGGTVSTSTQNIVGTSSSPMLNRSELATKISPLLTYTSTADAAIKANRESTIRALADVGDTRTWNLLIDVIAQAGRFPSSATQMDQFIVEGEVRYWLHVAIDRYTGQVIDQSLEVFHE